MASYCWYIQDTNEICLKFRGHYLSASYAIPPVKRNHLSISENHTGNSVPEDPLTRTSIPRPAEFRVRTVLLHSTNDIHSPLSTSPADKTNFMRRFLAKVSLKPSSFLPVKGILLGYLPDWGAYIPDESYSLRKIPVTIMGSCQCSSSTCPQIWDCQNGTSLSGLHAFDQELTGSPLHAVENSAKCYFVSIHWAY